MGRMWLVGAVVLASVPIAGIAGCASTDPYVQNSDGPECALQPPSMKRPDANAAMVEQKAHCHGMASSDMANTDGSSSTHNDTMKVDFSK